MGRPDRPPHYAWDYQTTYQRSGETVTTTIYNAGAYDT